MLNDARVVEEEDRLHDVAEAVEVWEAFEVFGHLDEGYEFADVVVAHDGLPVVTPTPCTPRDRRADEGAVIS